MASSSKPLRFQQPTQLNPDTRVLTRFVPGGITLGEWQRAWEQWWLDYLNAQTVDLTRCGPTDIKER